MFIAALLGIAQTGNSPVSANRWMKNQKHGIAVWWTTPQKSKKPATNSHNNMGEISKTLHWKKLQTKQYKLYNSIYMKF